jgi:hypothetical protein
MVTVCGLLPWRVSCERSICVEVWISAKQIINAANSATLGGRPTCKGLAASLMIASTRPGRMRWFNKECWYGGKIGSGQ